MRYVSHTPAPVLALAAVPLLRGRSLRATGAMALAPGLLLALRGPGESTGAVPLAFDLALALLAGLSLSAQWRWRLEGRGPDGCGSSPRWSPCSRCGGLSVATALTGPLAPELAAPVGLLALAFILYVLLAGARGPAVARLFLLPLVASFLLQPWGRQAWAGAPTAAALEEGTPTRRAIDRIMGAAARRADPLPGRLVAPGPRADDLAFGQPGPLRRTTQRRRATTRWFPLAAARSSTG